MLDGFPFMCIKMYGTLNSLIRLNKLLSNSHAEISLIRDAPSFNASLATSCRNVSTEIIASGILLFMLLIILLTLVRFQAFL